MSFKSVLSDIGGDVKKVFAWIGSPSGQNIVADGAAVVDAVDPALTGVVSLAETWIKNAFTVESLAAAAGAQNGTSAQKAAAVIAAVTPSVLAYAKAAGVSAPTEGQIANANNAIVAFLNAFGTTA